MLSQPAGGNHTPSFDQFPASEVNLIYKKCINNNGETVGILE